MFSGIRHAMRASLQATGVLAATLLSALVTLCFLAAAAFVFVFERHGPVAACLACAAMFLVIAAIGASLYAHQRHARATDERRAEPSPLAGMLSDPMLLGLGVQAVRTVGLKRLLPVLAIGGLALGLMAGRQSRAAGSAEPAE